MIGTMVLAGLGCEAARETLDPLNLTGLASEPVRVGVTTLDMKPPLMWPRRHLFRLAMANHLEQPVQFEVMTPRQIRVHLGTGRLQMAMLQPGDVTEVMEAGNAKILAVPVGSNLQPDRQGLIIVGPKSDLNSLADFAGHRFHFLQRDDLLNLAALGTLLDAGVSEEQIDKGILGLGLDTYHLNSVEVAKSVAVEQNAFGVIEESAYQKWPATGGSMLLLRPSKDQVRVIAKTVRIPGGPIVIARDVSPDFEKRVKEFLFDRAPTNHRLALAAMDVVTYSNPIDPRAYDGFGRIWTELKPIPWYDRLTVTTRSTDAEPVEASEDAPHPEDTKPAEPFPSESSRGPDAPTPAVP